MRKKNKLKRLHRTHEHRKAMLNNMAESIIYHERIKSTTGKLKAARSFVERLITRARYNLGEDISTEKKVHNIRIVGRFIKNKEVLDKLFSDVAPRFKDLPGGYTRIIKLGHRNADNSEMAFLELVERKELAVLKDERKKSRADFKNHVKASQTQDSTDKEKTREKSKETTH